MADMTLGEAVLILKGDIKDLEAKLGLAKEKVNSTVQKISDRMKSVGKSMTIVGGAITGVSGLLIKSGMDAVESENLFTVSMGDMADSARAWSEDLRRDLGLNAYEVRKSVSTYNVMLDAMGLGEEKSFDMAKGLTQLSYDMASFYNLKPEEAFEKLQAAISGEVEPLRRLGINLTVAALEQDALNMGITKSWQEMTTAEQTMVRYSAIMKRTEKAQGDMARTLDSPTNKLRVMQSQMAQISTDIGMTMLPAFSALLDRLQPIITAISDWILKNPDLTATIALLVAGLGVFNFTLGPVVMLLGSIVPILPTIFKGLMLVVSGIKTLIPWLYAKAAAWAAAFWPLIAVVAVGGAFWMLGRWIDRITSDTRFGQWIDSLMDKVVALIAKIREWVSLIPGMGWVAEDKRPTVLSGDELRAARVEQGLIPQMATGGLSRGGLALVGERGPELVNLPAGSRVTPAHETRSAMGGVNIRINMGGVTVREKADINRIAQELGRRIDSRMIARGLRPITI